MCEASETFSLHRRHIYLRVVPATGYDVPDDVRKETSGYHADNEMVWGFLCPLTRNVPQWIKNEDAILTEFARNRETYEKASLAEEFWFRHTTGIVGHGRGIGSVHYDLMQGRFQNATVPWIHRVAPTNQNKLLFVGL